MTDKENKALYIAEECRKAGMTLAGASGVLANVEAESAFSPTNLQDTYERALGMTDESYTAAVDNGSYQNFTGDAAGYGLAQWTAGDRKAKMLAYFRQRGVSIGDFRTQVDFLLYEMKGYGRAWGVCTSSNSAGECGYAVCKYYEIPADTEKQAQNRAIRAQNWYSFLANAFETGQESSIPETGATGQNAGAATDEDGIKIPRTWPPRTISESRCDGWAEVWLLEALLAAHGFSVLHDGIFGKSLKEKVMAFQMAAGLETDGIVGPLTWAALGVKM